MKTIAEITRNMAQAIGTSQYIKHFTGLLVFTDGINQLRQDADAFWLVDIIASHQIKHRNKPFQVWELKVNDDKSAVVTMKEDSNTPVLVRQEIPYTDFPLDNIKLWVEEGGYGDMDNWTACLVLMLPSER